MSRALVAVLFGIFLSVSEIRASHEEDEDEAPFFIPSIVVLGDSVATGHSRRSFNEDPSRPATRGYPLRYQELLEDLSFEDITLDDRSVFGATVEDTLLEIRERPLCTSSSSDPDLHICPALVIIHLGANDFHYTRLGGLHWALRTTSSRQRHAGRHSRHSADDLRGLIDEVHAQAPEAQIFVLNYYNPSDRSHCRRLNLIGNDILFAGREVGLNEVLDEIAEEKREAIEESVGEALVQFVDISRPFRRHAIESEEGSFLFGRSCSLRRSLFERFDPHPNAAGQECIANVLFRETLDVFEIESDDPVIRDPCPDDLLILACEENPRAPECDNLDFGADE